MKILIIEDDPRIAEMVSLTIKIRWPLAICIQSSTGQDGIDRCAAENPTMVILDLGLPDMDGIDVLKQIRAFSRVPLIILTVRNEEADIVEGLELGADEYITKPFHQLEMLARIKCLLRHRYGESDEVELINGSLHFMPAKRRILQNGKEILLSETESRILKELMNNPGRAVSTTILAEAIWGESYPDAEKAIRVYIRRLREKLESDPSNPKAILTKPRLGYYLQRND